MSFFETLTVEILGGIVAGAVVAFAAFKFLEATFHLTQMNRERVKHEGEERKQRTESALAALGIVRDELSDNAGLTGTTRGWPTRSFALDGRTHLATPGVLSALDDSVAKDLLATYYALSLLNRLSEADVDARGRDVIVEQVRRRVLEREVERVRAEYRRLAEVVLGPQWATFSRQEHLRETPLAQLLEDLERGDVGERPTAT
jgi:hypothetical protein